MTIMTATITLTFETEDVFDIEINGDDDKAIVVAQEIVLRAFDNVTNVMTSQPLH